MKDFVDMAGDYGAKHMGKSMTVSTSDTVRQALNRMMLQRTTIYGIVEGLRELNTS